MTRERAIRLAEQWSEGGVCTLREGEAQEYHKMFLAALREQEEYEGLKNSYDQLQASFDTIFESNQKMGEAFRLLLNEQEERSKGCGYCDIAKANEGVVCTKLWVKEAETNKWTMMGKRLVYCPMCGRKLDKEDEN